MKKVIFTLVAVTLLLTANIASSQIVCEATYDSVKNLDFFARVHLKNSGEKFVRVGPDKVVSIFNADHSLWKRIYPKNFITGDCSVFPWLTAEDLYATDGKVYIVIFVYEDASSRIMDESGNFIFSLQNFCPYHTFNSPAIFTAEDGKTKLKMASTNDSNEIRIYSLPGTTGILENSLTNYGSINFFPNPTSGVVTIKYELPGKNDGEITLYNNQGQLIKKYLVSPLFKDLQISTYDLPAGNYYWRLESGNYRTAKQMIVIK